MKLRNLLSSAFALAVATSPFVARAEQDIRRSPLEDAPAVRKRVELRAQRFEIGASAGATVGQDFYHAILVGARASFHLTDWLAISGSVQQNLTPDLKTTLTDELEKRLNPMAASGDRSPPRGEAIGGLNKIGQVFAVQGELVPFTGKYALFSKLFLDYDFYAFGGAGFINYTASGMACAGGASGTPAGQSYSPSCPDTGMKIGPTFGIGTHSFINRYLSVNVELRDIYLRVNPAGRDATGDMRVDSNDVSWNHNFIVTLSLAIFFPTTAAISD
jgi:outer membrane beta-barrel protein